MPKMDSFRIVRVIRGRLKAKTINVRPLSFGGPSYPKSLAEGSTLTLRLNLSDETMKQSEENEHKDYPWLIVNGDEVEQIATP